MHIRESSLLVKFSQKTILKIDRAKIKCFFHISIAINRPNFKKGCIQVCSQKCRRMYKIIYIHYLACSQTWLNLPVDHCHYGYTTKFFCFCFFKDTNAQGPNHEQYDL
jgi:hypothetical protein